MASCVWVLFFGGYTALYATDVSFAPQNLGLMIAGFMVPPALVWMILNAAARREDVMFYSETLKADLESMLFPSEETARIINKDIERLCRQAAEVSTASKAVLKSLNRARHGLRNEIRDFSNLSNKAEHKIEGLAEAMRLKIQGVSELSATLDDHVQAVEKNIEVRLNDFETLGSRLEDKADRLNEKLEIGTKRLNAVTVEFDETWNKTQNSLDATISSMSKTSSDIGKRLEKAHAALDGDIDTIRTISDEIGQKIEEAGQEYKGHIQDFDTSVNEARQGLDLSASQWSELTSRLSDTAGDLHRQGEVLRKAVDTSVYNLEDTVGILEDKSEECETRLNKSADVLYKASLNLETHLTSFDTVNIELEERASAIEGVASMASEKLTDSCGQLAKNLADMQNQTQASIRDLKALDQDHQSVLSAMTEMMKQSALDLEGSVNTAKNHCQELESFTTDQEEKLKLYVATISDNLKSVEHSLEIPLDDLNHAINRANASYETIEATLSKRVGDLNAVTEKASESSLHICTVLKEQAQNIATLSGSVAGHSKRLTEQLEVSKTALKDEIEGCMDGLETVTGKIDEKAGYLSHISVSVNKDMEDIHSNLFGHCGKIEEITANAFEHLQGVDQALEAKITLLKTRSDEALGSVADVQEALNATVQYVDPLYRRAIDRMDKTQERFEVLKHSFENISDSNLEKLHQIGIVFDERLEALKGGTEEAEEALEHASHSFEKKAETVMNYSDKAVQKVSAVSDVLNEQFTSLHLTTDQAVLKMETTQKAAQEQFHDFLASIAEAKAQLESAGYDFEGNANKAVHTVEKAEARLMETGEKMRLEAKDFEAQAHNIVQNAGAAVQAVEQKTQTLVSSAKSSLDTIKHSGEQFGEQAEILKNYMNQSLESSKAYSQELKSQACLVADASQLTSEKITKATGALQSNIDGIHKISNDTSQKLKIITQDLGDESSRLVMVSKESIESVQKAAQGFGKQSESLFKASQDAAQQAQKLEQGRMALERGAFMNSAKFVIESLHSMAVDFNRMLDGDVPEKTWKAYQKGDMGAFTRRLVGLEDKVSIQKAREKYSKDHEFRTYIQRYIRQFEELYKHAERNDHNAVLSATFASSEIGKLYEFLCQVSAKQSCFHKETLKAA